MRLRLSVIAAALALVSWSGLVAIFGIDMFAAALWTIGAPVMLVALGVLVLAVMISAFDDGQF